MMVSYCVGAQHVLTLCGKPKVPETMIDAIQHVVHAKRAVNHSTISRIPVSNCSMPQTNILLMRLLCVTCLVVGVVGEIVIVIVMVEVNTLPNWHHMLILPFRIWRVGI